MTIDRNALKDALIAYVPDDADARLREINREVAAELLTNIETIETLVVDDHIATSYDDSLTRLLRRFK